MKGAPVRLRVRIAVLVGAMALGGFLVTAGVGGWIVLEAEDAIIATTVDAAAELAWAYDGAPRPAWLAMVPDAAGVQRLTGLAPPPQPWRPGWLEVFGNEARTEAIWVDGLTARLAMWFTPDREQEYRVWVPDPATGPGSFLVADLAQLEFTESRTEAVSAYLWWLAAGVAGGALLVVALVVRWTLAPVLRLARRVRSNADPEEEWRLADGLATQDEIGLLARELDRARARAREAVARERLFIAECSHELRTPLSTLKSAHTLWSEVADDAAARDRVWWRMQRSIGRMERLVYDFLVLAREGRQPTDGGAVPLWSVVGEAVEEQQALLAGRGCRVEVDIPESVNVEAPRDVVLSIVHNLVSNAFKHAPGGRLRVVWLAEERCLRFDDDGPGFAPEAESGGPRQVVPAVPGFGLGWSLAQRLCHTQGWHLARGQSEMGGARIDVEFDGSRSAARPDHFAG